MIGPLNHVGVAVPSIEKAIETYKDLYNATDITEIGEMTDQGVRFCFINLPNSQIELIEPLGDGSPIQNFLDKNPKGGQHHICFEVKDIHEAKIEMEENKKKMAAEKEAEREKNALNIELEELSKL